MYVETHCKKKKVDILTFKIDQIFPSKLLTISLTSKQRTSFRHNAVFKSRQNPRRIVKSAPFRFLIVMLSNELCQAQNSLSYPIA